MAAEDTWNQPPLQVTEPATLRAFAHPTRQRILRELAVRTHARAADLARWTGEPANSLSFHLRTLASAGLIRELPEKGRDKRDRVWELANQGGYTFEDPIADPGVSSFVAERFDWLRRLLAREFDDEQSVSTVQFGGALLTKAEAKEFSEQLGELLTKWRKHGAEAAERDPADTQRRAYDVAFALGRSAPPAAASQD
ncbi:winged helix-turn-helix domain-containing protein [Gryllotalpicola protaetiae]|uniref:ArsR family transcriptional regulator n=1 Tax=Gryllotalpicola protaetiae TaxID=2419771 RepID=A0A387BQS0_9MICO|nr:helix-turn-helix domain-containing protein [Gryllotalpicola protaetiae]AYG03337.1 ArsR family transcriptional regulator [Gryllotalpicola protaetiae]